MSPKSHAKRSFSLRKIVREKIAKLRKEPHVTEEQRLQSKIDTFNTQAKALEEEVTHLQSQAANFATRADKTPVPSEPPPDRDPLFESSNGGPPSNYEAQVRNRNVLLSDWKAFEKEVRAFNKKLDDFEDTLEHSKKRHVDPEKAVGFPEHQFEGLNNALHKLKEQRVALGDAVAGVPLPTGK